MKMADCFFFCTFFGWTIPLSHRHSFFLPYSLWSELSILLRSAFDCPTLFFLFPGVCSVSFTVSVSHTQLPFLSFVHTCLLLCPLYSCYHSLPLQSVFLLSLPLPVCLDRDTCVHALALSLRQSLLNMCCLH